MESIGRGLARVVAGGSYRRADRQGGEEFVHTAFRRREIPLSLAQSWSGASRRMRRPASGGIARWSRALAILFFGAVCAYGLSAGGHVERAIGQFAAETSMAALRAGFAVQQLSIEGQTRTSRDEIVKALEIAGGASMLSMDTAAAQSRLERLPWVKHAQVMRLLPSTLHISIEERTPFAIWQHDAKLFVVDADGKVLEALDGKALPSLPLIVGEGAADKAQRLFKILAAYPDLANRTRAAVRVGSRRWNLKLDNDIEIRLPEENIEHALDKLAGLDKSHGVMLSDVVAIDLRLPDRVTLRLTDAAAARWDEAVKRNERSKDKSARDT